MLFGFYNFDIAAKVYRHDEGVLDCNKQAAEKAFAHPKMNFIWNSVLSEIAADIYHAHHLLQIRRPRKFPYDHSYESSLSDPAPTGTEARVLGIPGERELTGMGVAYCATCDAEFFQDQEVVVDMDNR